MDEGGGRGRSGMVHEIRGLTPAQSGDLPLPPPFPSPINVVPVPGYTRNPCPLPLQSQENFRHDLFPSPQDGGRPGSRVLVVS